MNLKEMLEGKRNARKGKNKGFSLVELIIVIAIMAILVGVVGTQVLPYIEKSKRAKDMQVVSAVCTAAKTAFTEHAGELGATVPAGGYIYTYTDTDAAVDATLGSENAAVNITKDLKELLGVDTAATTILFPGYFGGATATKLESKVGKTATSCVITYTPSTGAVKVQLRNTAGDVLESVTSK